MNSIIDLHSYGHDIETAWLVDRGLEVLGDAGMEEKLSPITRALTAKIYERAYVDHSLLNESVHLPSISSISAQALRRASSFFVAS